MLERTLLVERRMGVNTWWCCANEECSHHSQDSNCSDHYKKKSERPERRGSALACKFKCPGCGGFVRYHCRHGSGPLKRLMTHTGLYASACRSHCELWSRRENYQKYFEGFRLADRGR